MILIVHIFMNVNKHSLNQQRQAFFLASVARIAYLMLGTIVALTLPMNQDQRGYAYR